MALTPVGSTTGTNSHGLPSGWAPGDIAITFAYRDGSTTPPTLPGTFTNIANGGANTNSSRTGVRVLQSGDTTFTWTNATSVVCLVYRPSNGTASVGASARGSGSSTTITYPAITLQDNSGSSWVLRFAGHRSTDVAIETVPSGGFTFRNSVSDATDEASGFDTNGGVTSMASGTASVGGTASGFEAQTIELRFYPARDALAYRDSDSGGDSSFTNTQISVPAPTVVAGDLEVIWAAAAVLAPGTAPTLATPSGWNLGGTGGSVSSAGGLVNTRAHLFWRIASGAGSSATLDAGTTAVFVWARESYSNPDPTNPLRQVVFGSNASGNSSVLSSLNAVANSLLNAFISLGAAQSVTSPGSMTEREDNATYGVVAADEQASATGATGTRTFTYTTATEAVWGFAEFQGPISSTGVTVNLSVTDAADALSGAAALTVGASLSIADAADTLSSGTTMPVTAALSASDGADTLSSAATVPVAVALGLTDEADTLAATAVIGAAPVEVNFSQGDAADVLSGAAVVAVGSSLSASDAADALGATAALTVGLSLAQTDAVDTVAAASTMPVTVSASVTDGADTLAAAAALAVVAAFSLTDEADALASTATVQQAGVVGVTFDQTDAPDTLQASATVAQDERRGSGGINWWDDVPHWRVHVEARLTDDDDVVQASAAVLQPARPIVAPPPRKATKPAPKPAAVQVSVVDEDDALVAGARMYWKPARLVRSAHGQPLIRSGS